MKKSELLKIVQDKGWDGMLESMPCEIGKAGDPCESQKNAVKIACRNSDPLNLDKTCSDALDDLSDCMDEHYN